jgi:hypothetical protein
MVSAQRPSSTVASNVQYGANVSESQVQALGPPQVLMEMPVHVCSCQSDNKGAAPRIMLFAPLG